LQFIFLLTNKKPESMQKKSFLRSVMFFAVMLFSTAHNVTAQSTACFQAVLASYPPGTPIYVVSPFSPANYPGAAAVALSQSSVVLAMGLPLTGQIYFFDDQFTVNQTIGFTNCTMYMTVDVQILTNRTLFLTDNVIQAGCGAMWRSINLQGPKSQLYAGRNTISDMRDGITTADVTNELYADDNDFINNERSIYILNTPSNYPGTITQNNFSTVGSLLSGGLALVGIQAENCKYLPIGSLATAGQGNSFTNMKCGVDILSTITTPVTYEVIDTKFDLITGASSTNAYNNRNGAGIFCKGGSPANRILITNQGGIGGLTTFTNSNKGVVIDNMTTYIGLASFTNIIKGVFLRGSGYAHGVIRNTFDDTYYAISLMGAQNSSNVAGNRIILKNVYHQHYWLGATQWFDYPIGIEIRHQSTSNANTALVRGNYVEVNTERGVGIEQGSACAGLITDANSIVLNAPAFSAAGFTFPIAGIFSDGNSQMPTQTTTIAGNTIFGAPAMHYNTGIFPPAVTGLNEPAGVTLNNSRPTAECNNLFNTRYGFQVMGNCNPTGMDNLRTRNNQFTDNSVGIMLKFVGGTSSGLGANLGNSAQDNNNVFQTALPTCDPASFDCNAGVPMKIYFFQSGINPRNLYTNTSTLLASESSSNSGVLSNYLVGPTPGDTVTCAPQYFGRTTSGAAGYTAAELAYLESVARAQNPESLSGNAQTWLQAMELYHFVYQNQDVLGMSPVVDSFWSAMPGSSLEALRLADAAFDMLADSATKSDSTLYAQALAAAGAAINAIAPANAYDAAEKDMRLLLLKQEQYGSEALTATDLQAVEDMAVSCPFDMGLAVSQARYLYHSIIGHRFFDDAALCGSSNSRLATAAGGAAAGDFQIFPNPATDRLTVNYKYTDQEGDAVFQLRNIFGQLVGIHALPKAQSSLSIHLADLSSGLYYYQVQVNGSLRSPGKLVIAR
jgi:hypothetical protein